MHCRLIATIVLALVSFTFAADWPQWRGPDRNGVSGDKNLSKRWPEGGPPVAWKSDAAGIGYSSIAVANDRIYTQGDLDNVEHVICLDARDGKLIWKYAPTPGEEGLKDNRGNGPRGTPVVVGDRVYCEGGRGHVTCLDAATGKMIWQKSLVTDFGGKEPGWGYSESPLVTGDMVIVTPGGRDGTVVALHKDTGETIWRSKDLTEAAHYCSPQIATIAGTRQIVQMGRETVFGLDAKTGKLLWQYKGANNGTANVCMPIIDGDHVFASSAYKTGGGLIHITRSGDSFNAKEIYFEKKMDNHHGGIVKVGEHMYGFGQGGLTCMNFKTGEIAWTDRSLRKGSLIAADGMLYCLDENHRMGLIEANPSKYIEHGRFEVKNLDRPAWAHPVIANGRLYIRNQQELTAYDIGVKQAGL